MHEAPTYCLQGKNGSVAGYYRDAECLADEVLAWTKKHFEAVIKDFIGYCQEQGYSEREPDECALEILTLGVLWQVYGEGNRKMPELIRKSLVGAAVYRNRHYFLRSSVDLFRGVFATAYRPASGFHHEQMNLARLRNLIKWLAATGEFEQEWRKLRNWYFFLRNSKVDADSFLGKTIDFAAWFAVRGEEVLGRYTQNVSKFLSETLRDYRWREDILFCGRRPIEYHLNMVGAEILNCAYRDAFLATHKRMILLPVCMRLHNDTLCQAISVQDGLRCAECDPACGVCRIVSFAKAHAYTVLMARHESAVFRTGKAGNIIGNDVGVIGVACVLNLVASGWKAKKRGIPVQCVLLDYSGCKKHWHKEGLTTGLDMRRLAMIMGVNSK